MFDSPVDEIKNRLDIVDVISGYIKLKKAGRDYKAVCPFHSEKTPSFFVSPSKQIWHCFGCNLGGDMFSFVMQIEGVEFADALRILAKKAGVELTRQDPKLKSQRSKLLEICQEAAEFFEENLKKNKAVQEYLKKRGVLSESIKEFQIGYALDSWDALYSHLTDLGYKAEDIEKAGLIIQRTENREPRTNRNYYDRFRSRIMFPICDISGQIVGFTGRIFSGDESTAKYVNSPETLIFNKSQILYALDKAKVDIRKEDKCILVEGQMDVIMSHQVGNKNAVATSGTALTENHLKIIKRYTENLFLAFDTDTAGEEATKKGIGLAQKLEFNIKVIVIPEGKDPADIIKKDVKKWEKAINEAKPIMEFYFDNSFSKFNSDKIEERRKIAQQLLPSIKRIANEIERSYWLQQLAAKLNIDEKLLTEALAKVKIAGEDSYFSQENQSFKNKIELNRLRLQNQEENLLGLVLGYPEHLNYLIDNVNLNYFTNEITKKIFQSLKKQKSSDKINIEKIKKEALPNQPYYIDHIIFQIENYDWDDKEVLKEIKFYINNIKSRCLKKVLSEKSLAIKKAEREGNTKEVERLKNEFNNLLKNKI